MVGWAVNQAVGNRSHNIVQVAGDFVLNEDRSLFDIQQPDDIDHSILFVSNRIREKQKIAESLNIYRWLLMVSGIVPLPALYFGALTFHPGLLAIAATISTPAIIYICRIGSRLEMLRAELNAGQALLSELCKKQLSLQIREQKPR